MKIEAAQRLLAASKYKVTKQSLIDWAVTDDGKPYAWITKSKGLYNVTFREHPKDVYPHISFKEAKEFATRDWEPQ